MYVLYICPMIKCVLDDCKTKIPSMNNKVKAEVE